MNAGYTPEWHRSTRWQPIVLSAPAVALLFFFFVLPMVLLARVSLFAGGGRSGFGISGGGFYQPGTWTLDTYRNLITEPYFHAVLSFTILFGFGMTVLTVLLAYPLSLYIHQLPPKSKTVALTVVILPKLANLLVVVYGIELLLSNTGPINRFLLALGLVTEPVPLLHNLTSVVIGETYLILPYAVLILVTTLDRIDPTLVLAARGLGASPRRAFWTVTFPLSLPGVALAAMISWIWGVGAFISPYLLGSPDQITLAVEVQRQTFENINWPRGAATAILMLVTVAVSAPLFSLSGRLIRRRVEEADA